MMDNKKGFSLALGKQRLKERVVGGLKNEATKKYDAATKYLGTPSKIKSGGAVPVKKGAQQNVEVSNQNVFNADPSPFGLRRR